MGRKSIFFGFYKGLGDFVSDSKIIEYFYKNGFDVSVAVADWLGELAEFMFPEAEIIKYKNGKELFNRKYKYDYIFLSPNYLHPINVNYKSLPLYLIKYWAVRKNKEKNSVIIKPNYWELFNYYLNLKKTFLNEHFFYMSYKLAKKHFKDLPEIISDINQDNKKKKTIKRVFIFPFSGFKPKDYPVDRYIKIAKYLKDKYNLNATFFVVPKDREKIKNIEKEFKVESKSLVELAKMFTENDLVICSDSGPGHLAIHFGANAVILYSTTSPEKYKPIGKGTTITLKSKGKIEEIDYNEVLKKIEDNFILGE